jgi:hypothetical protein
MVAPHGRLLRRCWKRVDACCASSATITSKRVQLAIATRLRSAFSVIAHWLCTGISTDTCGAFVLSALTSRSGASSASRPRRAKP